MIRSNSVLVRSNGALGPRGQEFARDLKLSYLKSDCEPNVRLLLPKLIQRLHYLPPRLLDLLELAAFVFAADRLVGRGSRDAIENESWSRSIYFAQKVRDYDFWSDGGVRDALSSALTFATGDAEWTFEFQPGHNTPPSSLFDSEDFAFGSKGPASIMLFSGGLDSLTGALVELADHGHDVVLLSHQSGQPSTKRTQKKLREALSDRFPGKVSQYYFECGLWKQKSNEETQRTRAFLYTAMGFALARALGNNRILVHENGFTSLNLARRQDMLNARASRTTHPKTMAFLERLFSLIAEESFTIDRPFAMLTKTEVLQELSRLGHRDLLTSAVSCSHTFQRSGPYTHCGVCSQCIDRRFAVYAANLDEVETDALYALDFLRSPVPDGEGRTALVDYLRQASNLTSCNIDSFYREFMTELVDVVDAYDQEREFDVVESFWQLCQRQGQQVLEAIRRMQVLHDNPYTDIVPGSLFSMVSRRDYLRTPVELLIRDICSRLSRAIPKAFRRNPPKNEGDFNDKVDAILSDLELKREHPAVEFALGHAVPDFSSTKVDLFIESKFIRKNTPPSKVSEGIAADLIKYPGTVHKLFVVYDPGRAITDDEVFQRQFGNLDSTVFIVR